MHMFLKKTILLIGLCFLWLPSISIASSLLGTWQTIDDKSGIAKSHVMIFEENGTLSGKVTKILDPKKKNKICSACKGKFKDQTIQGMNILWGMQKRDNKYDGGKIIDPESGKIYKAEMRLLEDGKKLEVRGYIGFSLIGRSQYWNRVQN